MLRDSIGHVGVGVGVGGVQVIMQWVLCGGLSESGEIDPRATGVNDGSHRELLLWWDAGLSC